MTAQAELALFDPLEPRILPRVGWPFWTLNTRQPSGRLEQEPFRLTDLEYVLKNCRKDQDTYISQAFFSQPNRRAVNVCWLTHAFVDLDCYNLPGLPSPRHSAQYLRDICRNEAVPLPSLIIFSGRGLYLKWCWSAPVPRAAVGRAVAVNQALVSRFAAWGADRVAVDPSRILRVVGTINTKSNERAELLWREEIDGQLLTYDFSTFADEALPYTLEQVQHFRQESATKAAQVRILHHERARRQAQEQSQRARQSGIKAFPREDWHWGVLEDIRTVVAKRYPGGIVQEGARDLFGHLGGVQLAMVLPASVLWHEMIAWGRLILPPGYIGNGTGGEFYRHSSSLLQRAQADAAGQTVTYAGRRTRQVYTYRRATMIELLGITSDEMPHMTRLIDGNEKRRRDREATAAARRAAGVMERAAYEAAAADRADRAVALRAGGLSWQEVANRLELASADAARKLAGRAE